ncbi:ubiquinol-cytochrome C reductase [Polychaeton citri CBS 116435]|uniref:Complex III subunit 9 n=1 Tax=Polychaeton citri CBS 116435 TaxID=1314669 RepID=A0A9P4UTL8_9PEZI|nr:ubiquinol-cytochrome C reductase [Polychaeton citri CBS 116435]
MAGVLGGVYNAFIKRNTIFLTTIFVGAFGTEILFDSAANKVWDAVNRGRQWKDIKYRYLEAEEE